MSPPFVESNLKILSGEDSLAKYQFNTRVAKHYFCKRCGVHPFLQTPMGTDFWRVNIGCLEGIGPFTLETGLVDGASLPVMEGV